jgi:hypothetical protein
VFVPEPIPPEAYLASTSSAAGSVSEDDPDPSLPPGAPPPVPPDCCELQEVQVVACGGRGSVDGLLVPAGTPPGTYVLEVLDGVDPQCVRSVTAAEEEEEAGGRGGGGPESSAPPPEQLLPGDLADLCRLVPPAGSSLTSFKLIVASE